MTQWIAFLAYVVAGAVFATCGVPKMFSLRCLAITINVLFIAYGLLEHLLPVVLLHAILLPVNIVRLIQIGHPGLLQKSRAIFRENRRR